MSVVSYQDTLEYLYSQLPMYQRVGKAAYKANLDNTIALCDLLGNPQDDFKSIHIAGTNGKGSTAHFIASILQESGFKTGLYTSPHLVDFRERIRINGEMIPREFVIEFVELNKEGFNRIKPSFFEMTAGMAFDYFAREKVDLAIIEVGMGGRLDSTNIITPEISVITNIGYDHMQFLGNTLIDIAGEKAGIMKKGVPVLVGEKQEEVKDVFLSRAKEVGTDALFAVDDLLFAMEVIEELAENFPGHYQKKNIITTISAINLYSQVSGFSISTENISNGIKNVYDNTGLKGRWQVIDNSPLTICDVGHNRGGLELTVRQLSGMDFNNLHFVFGSVNDKEIAGILSLLPADAHYYFCQPDIPRGLDKDALLKEAEKAGLSGNKYDSVHIAFKAARTAAGKDDIVFIGGSTFVVAEVLAGISPH